MSDNAQNKKPITFSEIALALANDYDSIFIIDAEDDSYVEYLAEGDNKELIKRASGDNFYKDVIHDAREQVHPDDQDRFIESFRKENITEILRNGKSFSINYQLMVGGKPYHYSLKTIKGSDDKVIIAVQNVDDQVRTQRAAELERMTYQHIAGALASRYEAIYYIDILDNSYIQYNAGEEYAKLGTAKEGSDFFVDMVPDVKAYIYKDDIDTVLHELDKETLLRHLDESGIVSLTYRQRLGDGIRYVTLNVVHPKNDVRHIIMGLVDVDAQMRREQAYEAAVGAAIDMANKDALTGVKNKHAYVNMESALDSEIGSGEELEFAIAVCDINGLKKVNDEQGHLAGDEYIKEACSIICEIFGHSPVFRYGGDEFVVVLRGTDYKMRHELFKQVVTRQRINTLADGVTFSFGMSEYAPESDLRVQDVFERADNLMYENKRRFKGKAFNFEDEAPDDESYSFVRFYELYEQLLREFVNFEEPNVPLIEELLIRFSKMFRLSKGITHVYMNPQEEREGKGEVLCCFDTHKEGVEILSIRAVTSVMSSAQMKIYMSPDEVPLSPEEMSKMELVVRTVLSFITRNRLKRIVYELAYYDESGYPNLRSWNKAMMDILHTPDFASKVFFRYNLRHFTLVNKEYGRPAGDRVMKSHFKGLESLIGSGGFLTRLGGDNYIGYCDRTQIATVIEYLTDTGIRVDENNSVKIKTSAGVFEVKPGFAPTEPGELMERITKAYIIAQSGGKDHIIFFDESLLRGKDYEMRVQQVFPEALATGEFVPFYQPKVDINTGKIVGGEALCRWMHDGRIVAPIEFIPALERTNDICKLDFYLLESVCRNQREWLDGGEGRKLVPMSINFSRKHIMNLDFPDMVERIMDKYRIPHDAIEVELTETTSDVEFSDIKRVVTIFRQKGINVSIDDFGMGFSSLNILKDIPWTTVKIDKSFLPDEDDPEDSEKRIMFRNVVAMTTALGYRCIAEGVETEYHVKMMRENGCSIAQGYYYDKPLPKEEFESRLVTKQYAK